MRDALKPRATGGEVSHGPRDTWGVHVPLETF
jgi:methylmalonyl-CoA mutase N-terminal domain/subunit